jgi:hypothetical protein
VNFYEEGAVYVRSRGLLPQTKSFIQVFVRLGWKQPLLETLVMGLGHPVFGP